MNSYLNKLFLNLIVFSKIRDIFITFKSLIIKKDVIYVKNKLNERPTHVLVVYTFLFRFQHINNGMNSMTFLNYLINLNN